MTFIAVDSSTMRLQQLEVFLSEEYSEEKLGSFPFLQKRTSR